MSRRDQLNSIARRQLETAGREGGLDFIADRLGILKIAAGFLDEIGVESYDIIDLLTTAEFLAGDRITER